LFIYQISPILVGHNDKAYVLSTMSDNETCMTLSGNVDWRLCLLDSATDFHIIIYVAVVGSVG